MRPPKASPLTAVQGLVNLAAQPSALDSRTAGRIVAGSVFLGLLGDLLLYDAALGLNVPLWTGAAIGVFFLVRRPGRPMAAHQLLLLLAAFLFAVMVAFRGSPALQAFDVLAVFGCLSLAAALPAGAGLRRLSLVELTVRGTGAAVAFAAGVPRVALDSTWARRTGVRSRENTLVASRVALLSAPLLAVFGGLFVAADAVFQARVEKLVFLDLVDAWQHVFWFVGAGWFACGLLWLGHVVETPGDVEVEVPEARRLRSIETGVVLGSLAALFAAFVLVQVRYLFGGESLVQETIGLTYAEYARRGFFELVAASALLLPVLLAFDWARRQDRRSSQVFRGLVAVLVLLLFVVMASAVERMRVYMDTFGLTELRVYVVTFLLTLGVVFVWFLWTVLRGRRSEFVLGAGAAALVALLALNVSSPDALIASTNTSRLDDGRSFDAYYASMLGPEAAPILAERIDRLEAADACIVARALLAEWSDDGDGVRSWNLGRQEARDAVKAHRDELEAACGPG